VLAKKTVKNQITLPKRIAEQFPGTEYFDVRVENGHIVLEPLKPHRADRIREKLSRLGISEKDIRDAVAWARAARR
jgi:bifunctional DNA-binding transcriptional regulator/antitoxin component of YhaV-PrlF toxin-antitoxin module